MTLALRMDGIIRDALDQCGLEVNRDRSEVARIVLTAFVVENQGKMAAAFDAANVAVARWKMERVHLSEAQLQQMRDTLKTPKRERKSGA